jgi:hypothetical protein
MWFNNFRRCFHLTSKAAKVDTAVYAKLNEARNCGRDYVYVSAVWAFPR